MFKINIKLYYITLHYSILYYINYADDNCRLTSVNYNLHSKQLYIRDSYVNHSFTTLKSYLSNELFLQSQMVVFCVNYSLN